MDAADPVALRIARLLDAKRRDNAEILSALKVAEEGWARLNKEVDAAVGREFDLIASEHDAVLAARDRIKDPDTRPAEDSQVFTGRVFDAASGTGLPQITVRVQRDREAVVLGEAVTDSAGAFRIGVPPADDDEPVAVRIDALQPLSRKPLASQRLSLPLRRGAVEQVDFPVKQTRPIADLLAAGESAQDSIDETVAAVELRLASMQAAHTAAARFSELTRDGLKELTDALATDPPPVDAEPGEPHVEAAPALAFARARSTPLVRVPGIGPRLADRLRDAGISDVEGLVAAPLDSVVDVLGDAAADKARTAATKLLENA